MYVLFTRGGIVAADSYQATKAIVDRATGSIISGEAAVVGVEYVGAVAETYDTASGIEDWRNIGEAIASGDIDNAARDATSVAIGTIVAEIVAASATGPLAPVVIIGGGIVGSAYGRDFYDGMKAIASQITEEDIANAFDEIANRVLDIVLRFPGIPDGMSPIDRGVSTYFGIARNPPRRDPLTLDLDNDGIETTGANGRILFDHDGDGIRTGTGWVKADDGLLVLDRNANGTIDSGAELFGVDTVLSDGTKATDGFAALRDQDDNADGVFDAADSTFAQVRVWQDLNQDGISQAEELTTLADQGITAISLSNTAVGTELGNGNAVHSEASFTRSDATTGTAYALDLADNPFYSQFPETIPLTEQAQSLPNMRGSGMVRSLREAASLDAGVAALLVQASAGTREAVDGNLDDLLLAWGKTSDLVPTIRRLMEDVHKSGSVSLSYGGISGDGNLSLIQTWADSRYGPDDPDAFGVLPNYYRFIDDARAAGELNQYGYNEGFIGVVEAFNGLNLLDFAEQDGVTSVDLGGRAAYFYLFSQTASGPGILHHYSFSGESMGHLWQSY